MGNHFDSVAIEITYSAVSLLCDLMIAVPEQILLVLHELLLLLSHGFQCARLDLLDVKLVDDVFDVRGVLLECSAIHLRYVARYWRDILGVPALGL